MTKPNSQKNYRNLNKLRSIFQPIVFFLAMNIAVLMAFARKSNAALEASPSMPTVLVLDEHELTTTYSKARQKWFKSLNQKSQKENSSLNAESSSSFTALKNKFSKVSISSNLSNNSKKNPSETGLKKSLFSSASLEKRASSEQTDSSAKVTRDLPVFGVEPNIVASSFTAGPLGGMGLLRRTQSAGALGMRITPRGSLGPAGSFSGSVGALRAGLGGSDRPPSRSSSGLTSISRRDPRTRTQQALLPEQIGRRRTWSICPCLRSETLFEEDLGEDVASVSSKSKSDDFVDCEFKETSDYPSLMSIEVSQPKLFYRELASTGEAETFPEGSILNAQEKFDDEKMSNQGDTFDQVEPDFDVDATAEIANSQPVRERCSNKLTREQKLLLKRQKKLIRQMSGALKNIIRKNLKMDGAMYDLHFIKDPDSCLVAGVTVQAAVRNKNCGDSFVNSMKKQFEGTFQVNDVKFFNVKHEVEHLRGVAGTVLHHDDQPCLVILKLDHTAMTKALRTTSFIPDLNWTGNQALSHLAKTYSQELIKVGKVHSTTHRPESSRKIVYRGFEFNQRVEFPFLADLGVAETQYMNHNLVGQLFHNAQNCLSHLKKLSEIRSWQETTNFSHFSSNPAEKQNYSGSQAERIALWEENRANLAFYMQNISHMKYTFSPQRVATISAQQQSFMGQYRAFANVMARTCKADQTKNILGISKPLLQADPSWKDIKEHNAQGDVVKQIATDSNLINSRDKVRHEYVPVMKGLAPTGFYPDLIL